MKVLILRVSSSTSNPPRLLKSSQSPLASTPLRTTHSIADIAIATSNSQQPIRPTTK